MGEGGKEENGGRRLTRVHPVSRGRDACKWTFISSTPDCQQACTRLHRLSKGQPLHRPLDRRVAITRSFMPLHIHVSCRYVALWAVATRHTVHHPWERMPHLASVVPPPKTIVTIVHGLHRCWIISSPILSIAAVLLQVTGVSLLGQPPASPTTFLSSSNTKLSQHCRPDHFFYFCNRGKYHHVQPHACHFVPQPSWRTSLLDPLTWHIVCAHPRICMPNVGNTDVCHHPDVSSGLENLMRRLIYNDLGNIIFGIDNLLDDCLDRVTVFFLAHHNVPD